jgi:ABC-type antimicrobial peptide transport system permease subunit
MKAGALARLAWSDAWAAPARLLMLSFGIAVGVAALALIMALTAGIEQILLHHVLGVLPDQVVVEPSKLDVGPLQLGGGASLDEALITRLRALPGVTAAYRREPLPLPANLRAEYAGKRIYTDVLVEAIDGALVGSDVPAGVFVRRPPGQDVPVVFPAAMMQILNFGWSANTGLPALNPNMIIGHHFDLNIGSSSFKIGPTISMHCEIVGISAHVGVGGPSLPIDYLPELQRQMTMAGGNLPTPGAVSVTLQLASSESAAAVLEAVHAMGLATPQQERAGQLTAALRMVRVALSFFAIVILFVAATGIANGLALMVRDEAGEIGLFRAVGASRLQIRVLYLLRAGAFGVLGGAAGALLALTAAAAINALAARRLGMTLGTGDPVADCTLARMAGAAVFGLIISVLAGLAPAWQASQLDPAAILRER